MTRANREYKQPVWRLYLVASVIIALIGLIGARSFDLQITNNDVLQSQGDARTVRNEVIDAHRGNILDRNGQPLAISTPLKSLSINPSRFSLNSEQWLELSKAMSDVNLDPQEFKNKLARYKGREFLYIKRWMQPVQAQKILDLKLKGIYESVEDKRFYPLGEAAVHVVGLADESDSGQEGMEFAYDEWLQGRPGSVQFLKDLRNGIVSEVGVISVAEPGKDLELSIDSRIQFLAYKALKAEVTRHQAATGSAVVLDVESGEVLAMVNQPSYNPNNRSTLVGGLEGLRNRAIVDSLPPGSTIKAFTMAAALESGLFDLDSIIDTSPGCIKVDSSSKCDPKNYKELSLKRIIAKSSQVGAIKVGLALGKEPMLNTLTKVGFGQPVGSGFPSEAAGILVDHSHWSQSDIAAMAYGYGFRVSPLQLAQAYMVIANKGIKIPVSLLKVNGDVKGQRVFSEEIAMAVTDMLEAVVIPGGGGTGTRAYVPSYSVAGKTGTIRNYDSEQGGYDSNSHTSLFVGFAPASNPKIVTVVTIKDPKGVEYGGGQVAAPVFSTIVSGAMRILNVVPDQIEKVENTLAQGGAL